jgi:hypothetical protein
MDTSSRWAEGNPSTAGLSKRRIDGFEPPQHTAVHSPRGDATGRRGAHFERQRNPDFLADAAAAHEVTGKIGGQDGAHRPACVDAGVDYNLSIFFFFFSSIKTQTFD